MSRGRHRDCSAASRSQRDQVPPNGLKKIYLPWVPALKGPEADACANGNAGFELGRGAGRRVPPREQPPVTVYQFNALEYRGAGGPPWQELVELPGNQTCQVLTPELRFSGRLLLVLERRVAAPAEHGDDRQLPSRRNARLADGEHQRVFRGHRHADGTTVNVNVASPRGQVAQAGSQIPATGPGQSHRFELNAGDVALFVSPASSDLSGSLVHATNRCR